MYLAMQSRGFRGEVYVLDDFRMQRADWDGSTGFFAQSPPLAVWTGR